MKIVFIPDYRRKNPYQKILSNSVKEQGASIYFSPEFHPMRLTSLIATMESILKYKPDILHIHWTSPLFSANNRFMTIIKSGGFLTELLLLKMFGIKIVWTAHNIVDHEAKFKNIELIFIKLLARLCDKIIVHCPSAKKEVMRVTGISSSTSIAVIPHGNYIGYKNVITNLEARNKLNLSTEDIVFLYFGQIRSYKGIPELIDSFNRLNCKEAKLLIVGKPFDDTKEILYCKDNYRNIKIIPEFIPDDDIQIYMNAADIVVLPYKDILTSGSILLAMSFGKPVIAPSIFCIADILKNGNFLYSKDDKDGLLKAMKYILILDVETLRNMGEYNLKLAKQFGWDDIGMKTYNNYQKLIKI